MIGTRALWHNRSKVGAEHLISRATHRNRCRRDEKGTVFWHDRSKVRLLSSYRNRCLQQRDRKSPSRHDRVKVRGDYGDGYGTGCVVRVRLDTDRGTLSFGLSNAHAGAGGSGGNGSGASGGSGGGGDANGGNGTGAAAVREWGVAFDGLPR